MLFKQTEPLLLTNKIIEPLRLKEVIKWYLFCVAAIFIFMASGGECKSGGIVYCYGDERDYWWHYSKVIFSFFFALILPIPNILISIFFKNNRSLDNILKIIKKWHFNTGTIITVLLVLDFAVLKIKTF